MGGGSGVRPRGGAEAGFTLLELIIVVAIIGILATIAMPKLLHTPDKAKEAVLRTDLRTFRDVIDQYYADKGKYPAELAVLVDDGYMRSIPVDPMTKSPDTGCRCSRSRSSMRRRPRARAKSCSPESWTFTPARRRRRPTAGPTASGDGRTRNGLLGAEAGPPGGGGVQPPSR
jgi:general secretion pathway protein G